MTSYTERGGGEEPAMITIRQIGVIHSCYTEKFGIPRQSGMVDKAVAVVELFAPYNREELVKELEGFSHIWVHFVFHEAVAEGWRDTVRPPGLGGRKRVGVFASRSPHRPNHLGLSAVRLLEIGKNENGVYLVVGGGDFLDATPVIDIKPYVPYSDSIEGAAGGFAGQGGDGIEVRFSQAALAFCKDYEVRTGRDLQGLICQVLMRDPRPASQHGRKQDFGILLWDINIRWKVEGSLFTVLECNRSEKITG